MSGIGDVIFIQPDGSGWARFYCYPFVAMGITGVGHDSSLFFA